MAEQEVSRARVLFGSLNVSCPYNPLRSWDTYHGHPHVTRVELEARSLSNGMGHLLCLIPELLQSSLCLQKTLR